LTILQKLGESKLAAMTEGQDFRAGTKSLLWERDRLELELRDLRAKWTDIHHTKVTDKKILD
jgi:hypothetical protein